MIKAINLKLEIDGNIIIKNSTFDLPNKGIVYITGDSGAGKTRLLSLISSFNNNYEGELLIDGKDLKNYNKKELSNYRKNVLGQVYQFGNLMPNISVLENIKLTSELKGIKLEDKKIEILLKELEIEELVNRKVSSLSGGERQRLYIFNALIFQPKILLLDEVTNNLGEKYIEIVMDKIKTISENTLIVIVTHNNELLMKYPGDRLNIENKKVTKLNETNNYKNNVKEVKHSISKSNTNLIKFIFKTSTKNLLRTKIRVLTLVLLFMSSIFAFTSSYTLTNYDFSERSIDVLNNLNLDYVEFSKESKEKYTREEIKIIQDDFEGVNISEIYSLNNMNLNFPSNECNDPIKEFFDYAGCFPSNYIYSDDISSFLNNGSINTTEDGVYISDFMAERIIQGLGTTQVLGYEIVEGIEIVGVYETGYYDDLEKLEELIEKSAVGTGTKKEINLNKLSKDEILFYQEWNQKQIIYSSFISENKDHIGTVQEYTSYRFLNDTIDILESDNSLGRDTKIGVWNDNINIIDFIDNKTSLLQGEIVINRDVLNKYIEVNNLDKDYEITAEGIAMEILTNDKEQEFKVVGVYDTSQYQTDNPFWNSSIVISDTDLGLFNVNDSNVGFSAVVNVNTADSTQLYDLLNYVKNNEMFTALFIASPILEMSSLNNDSVIESMNYIFYFSIVISLLLFSSFIYGNIKENSKMIAIFRSIGGNLQTIYLIYLLQSLMLMIPSIILGFITTNWLLNMTNGVLNINSGYYIDFYILNSITMVKVIFITLILTTLFVSMGIVKVKKQDIISDLNE